MIGELKNTYIKRERCVKSVKIGILTLYYKNYNYGGQLQAYALQRALEQRNYICEQITYSGIHLSLGKRIVKLWKGANGSWKNVLDALIEHIKYKIAVRKYQNLSSKQAKFGEKLRFERFISFMDAIPHSKIYDRESIEGIEADYDCVIAGSDQIWNPIWFDSTYFLDFLKSKPKIAYAASAGKDNMSSNEIETMCCYVKRFQTVSVREQQLVNILESKGIASRLVCDPVFLLSQREWRSIEKPPSTGDKFIFAYFLGEDRSNREIAKIIAKRMGVKLLMVPHVHSRYNKNDSDIADIEVWDAGPQEFIGLIDRAESILTDSFHGTAFSILLNKPFLCFYRKEGQKEETVNSRLSSLLHQFGLDNRLRYQWNPEQADSFLNQMDFNEVNRSIENLKKISYEYLEAALSKEAYETK